MADSEYAVSGLWLTWPWFQLRCVLLLGMSSCHPPAQPSCLDTKGRLMSLYFVSVMMVSFISTFEGMSLSHTLCCCQDDNLSTVHNKLNAAWWLIFCCLEQSLYCPFRLFLLYSNFLNFQHLSEVFVLGFFVARIAHCIVSFPAGGAAEIADSVVSVRWSL